MLQGGDLVSYMHLLDMRQRVAIEPEDHLKDSAGLCPSLPRSTLHSRESQPRGRGYPPHNWDSQPSVRPGLSHSLQKLFPAAPSPAPAPIQSPVQLPYPPPAVDPPPRATPKHYIRDPSTHTFKGLDLDAGHTRYRVKDSGTSLVPSQPGHSEGTRPAWLQIYDEVSPSDHM